LLKYKLVDTMTGFDCGELGDRVRLSITCFNDRTEKQQSASCLTSTDKSQVLLMLHKTGTTSLQRLICQSLGTQCLSNMCAKTVTRQMTEAVALPACPRHLPAPEHPQPSPISTDDQPLYQYSSLAKHSPLHSASQINDQGSSALDVLVQCI